MTSNEIRQIIGMKPSSDPKADELVNSNIAQPEEKGSEPNSVIDNRDAKVEVEKIFKKEEKRQNGL